MPPERVHGDGGVGIAAYRFGGAGPPLLLVHATGFHAHCWLPLLDPLRARFTVFAFDLRGHGESETPPGTEAYGFVRMARDLAAVLDHFGRPRVAAIGHSVGAALVIQAELDVPGTMTRAVLFEPIVLPPEQTEETKAAGAARKRRHVFDSTAQMIERWSSRPPFDTFDPAALAAYVEHGVRARPDGTVALKCSREAEVATFVNDTRTSIWAALGRYGTPSLIVAGGRSTSRAAPLAERQAARMANARAERFETLTHFLPFERPREMAARAIAFLT
ncbi:MAG: alpha/beta hydrolase [Candidatus Rokubacteria bacterium]|nr:alpha/beta hydrolase [Candidatus Rokubacteria bacterium]